MRHKIPSGILPEIPRFTNKTIYERIFPRLYLRNCFFFSKFFGIIAWNLSTKGRKIFRGNFIRNPWLICFGRFLDEFLIELFEISPAGIVEAMSEINRELFFEKINTKIVGSIIWKTSEDILVNFQDKSLSQIKTTGINVQWFFFFVQIF